MSASVKEVLAAMGQELFIANGADLTFEDQARDALRAAEQAGWVLVPTIPVYPMLHDGLGALSDEMRTHGHHLSGVDEWGNGVDAVYKAMLSAAPSVLEEK